MSFDFDPDDAAPSSPELNRIETQESANDARRTGAAVRIDPDLCEATGVCADVCPEEVLEHSHGTTRVINAMACTECWICIENCASGAIEIT